MNNMNNMNINKMVEFILEKKEPFTDKRKTNNKGFKILLLALIMIFLMCELEVTLYKK